MTVQECKDVAQSRVMLFACILQELDKIDVTAKNKIRIKIALQLTRMSLNK